MRCLFNITVVTVFTFCMADVRIKKIGLVLGSIIEDDFVKCMVFDPVDCYCLSYTEGSDTGRVELSI